MTAHDAGPVHGQLSYLQLPALDVKQSAAFYARIFGWQVDREHPSFEAPGLIGQWVTDRLAAPAAGPLLWIQVAQLDDALKAVEATGGQIIEQPSADGTERLLATIRESGRQRSGSGPELSALTRAPSPRGAGPTRARTPRRVSRSAWAPRTP